MKLHRARLEPASKSGVSAGKVAKARTAKTAKTAKATRGASGGGRGGAARETSAPRGGKVPRLSSLQKRLAAHSALQRKMGEKVAAGHAAAQRIAARKGVHSQMKARHAANAKRGFVAPPVVKPPVVKVGKPKKTRDAPKRVGGGKGRGMQEDKPQVTKHWRLARWEVGKDGSNQRGHDFWVSMGVDKSLYETIKTIAKDSGVLGYVLGDPPGTGVLQDWVDQQWEKKENPYIFDANAKGFDKYAEAYKKARPAIDLKMVKEMIQSYSKLTGKPVSARAMRTLLNINYYKMVFGQDGKVK